MARQRFLRRAWPAFLIVALGPGCSDTAAPAPAVEPAASLEAELEAPRYLADRRMLEIVLRNEGDEAIRIERFRVEGASFTHVDATVRAVEVPPGRRVDVPVPYGEAVCGTAPVEVVVALHLQDTSDPVQVPLRSGDVARRLHESECRQREIAAVADIGVGQGWRAAATPEGPAVDGILTIRRRAPDRRVTVVAMAGNVIFDLAPRGPETQPLLVLDPGQSAASVPIRVRATRCEPHAVAESKKTFLFPAWVAVDAGTEHYVEIEMTGRGRDLLQDNLDECADRSGQRG